MKKSLLLFQCLSCFLICLIFSPSAGAEILSGQADHTPWSGYWWPSTKGELVNGYFKHPSPFEKYDLYVSRVYPGRATQWESQNRYDPSALYWAGYCHAWANASILENIDFKSSTERDIFFKVGDKKGLLTACHYDDPQVFADVSADPIQFHQYLLDYIGEKKMAIAADLDSSEQFWSYPIYRYEMTISPGSTDDTVQCKIYYADDFVDPDYQGTHELSKTYNYTLHKGSQGYDGGHWSDSSQVHPQWVWIPVSQETENTDLDCDVVRNIAIKVDDEHENQVIDAPGHYALIVYPGEMDSFNVDIPAGCQVQFSLGLDSQTKSDASATFELNAGSQGVAGGPVQSVLTTYSIYQQTSQTYTLSISSDSSNSNEALVHLYFDVVLPYNYYLPHIPNENYWMGLAYANQNNSADNQMFVTFMSGKGMPLGDAYTFHQLKANQNWVGLLEQDTVPREYFTQSPASLIRITAQNPLNIMNIIGSTGDVAGNVNVENNETTINDYRIIPILTQPLEITKSSKVFLYNPNPDDISCKIKYFSNSGVSVGQKDWQIDANTYQSFSPNDYPGNTMVSGWGLITGSDNGPLNQNLDGHIEVEERPNKQDQIPLLTTGMSFYVPNVSSTYGWETTLTLINPQSDTNAVYVTCMNGSQIGTTLTVNLTQYEKKEILINGQQFNITDEQASQSWLSIQADKSTAGFVSYRYSNNSLASFPLFQANAFSSDKTVCMVASNSIWWTGLVVLNSSPANINLTITSYDYNGTILDTKYFTMESNKKWIYTVRDIFGEQSGQIASIRINTSDPVIGFAVYGTIDQTRMLSGIVLN